MTRALKRSNFHSSRLIQVLAELAVVDATEPGIAFAEKLGQWLSLNDAITLCADLNASAASQAAAPSAAKSVARLAIDDELTRTRVGLMNSIMNSRSSNPGKQKIALPLPGPGVPLEVAADYEPYRRYYLAHQRDMEACVRPLRARARERLASASPGLKKLAALDATLDAVLCDRESKLLATVPLLLEKRFEKLLKAHQQRLVDAQQTDDPALWMNAGAWLERFCNELQTALLAELDLRLQPTLGLIEAFNNEITKHK